MSIEYVNNKNGHCRLCTEPDSKCDMVQCDDCDRWFHLSCAKLGQRPTAEDEWLCIKCTIRDAERTELLQLKDKLTISNQLNETIKMKQEISAQRVVETNSFMTRQALIKLPKFNGSAREWPKFKSIFDDTTAEGKFTNLENLSRLEEALEGQAAKSVSGLMVASANVPRIMQRLEEIYGRPDIIYKQLLEELMKVISHSKGNVIQISEALDTLVVTMETLNKREFLQDYRLITEIISKLPFTLQVKWSEVRQQNELQPTLRDLNKWLQPHAKTLRLLNPNSIGKEIKPRLNMHNSTKRCSVCTKDHQTFNCNKFKNFDIDQREQEVRRLQLCFACLEKGHRFEKCRNKRRCGIEGCNMEHNRLLHRNKRTKPNEGNAEANAAGTNNHHCNMKRIVYYQIIPVTLHNRGKSVRTYAFLDPGSSLSLLDREVADELGLQGRLDSLELTWTQNITRETPSRRVCLRISGRDGKEYTMRDVRAIENLELPMQSLDIKEMQSKYKHLAEVPIEGYVNAKPTLLIGLEHAHLLMTTERRFSDENSPMAIIMSEKDKTKLASTEKRKADECEPVKDLKKAKLETKALKAKRPGFTDERYHETSYYIENGLRKVYPYYFTFTTFTKGRWVGEKILDVFAREFRAHPAEEYERCIKAGTLTVNYEKVPTDYRLKHNDLLANIVHRHEVPVTSQPITIVHMDDDIVVVNKPASIPVHPCGRYRHNTVVFILAKEYNLKNLRTIHRLDRLTSGLLLFGRSPKKARQMEHQIRNRQVQKEYICRVEGEFPDGIIECKEPIEVVSYKIGVCKVSPKGKECTTTFQKLGYNGTSSVVLCKPLTGRMHQIRVHLQYLGYPVVNDPLYNHEVFGPSKGRGGDIGGKSDEQLVKDLINIHNAENWLGIDGDSELSMFKPMKTDLEDGKGPILSDDDSESVSREASPCSESPRPVSLGSESPNENMCASILAPNTLNVVGSANTGSSNSSSTALNTRLQSQKVTVATQTGHESPDLAFNPDKMTTDKHCYECKVRYRDPKPQDLVMYLHAWKYKGPGWEYETELPEWARVDWHDNDFE